MTVTDVPTYNQQQGESPTVLPYFKTIDRFGGSQELGYGRRSPPGSRSVSEDRFFWVEISNASVVDPDWDILGNVDAVTFESPYRNRLDLLLAHARADEIEIGREASEDFWRFVDAFPSAPKGYLTATLDGSLNLFWRRNGERFSIYFLGGGNVRLVVLSTAHPPVIEDTITLQQLFSELRLGYKEWVCSPKMEMSSGMSNQASTMSFHQPPRFRIETANRQSTGWSASVLRLGTSYRK